MSEEKLSKTKDLKKPLSAALVLKLLRDAEPGHYGDQACPCLYLVIDGNGSRKWVLRVTIHGKRHDLGLGSAQVVNGEPFTTLAKAREKALELRRIARDGGDPLEVRRKERQPAVVPLTFEESAREVHKAHAPTFRNDKHAEQWIASLDTYVFPQLGSRRVDQIDSGAVLSVLSPIWIRIPETARRVRQRMKVVFDWAKAKGYRTGDNPVDGVAKVLPKHNTKQEHHAALPHAELSAFLEKLRGYDGVSTRLAFEFLILTAARTSEVLHAKWKEFDLEGKDKTWTVPADRMKAKVEHRVPLSARCAEILTAAKAISDGGEYVFPGSHLRKPLSNMTFIKCLLLMKYDHITVHGFRSTFRDWAEEKTNFSSNVIEAALAHTVKNKVEAAYLRTTLFEKRQKLMLAWTQFATAPAAKVVRFRA